MVAVFTVFRVVPEGRPWARLPVIHPRVSMVIYGRDRVGSIRNGDHAIRGWGSDLQRSRIRSRGACSRCGLGRSEGTDVPVAEAVVDQGEQLTGGRDGGDVTAPTVRDPGPR